MKSCRNKIVYRFSSAFRQHFTSYFATPPPPPTRNLIPLTDVFCGHLGWEEFFEKKDGSWHILTSSLSPKGTSNIPKTLSAIEASTVCPMPSGWPQTKVMVATEFWKKSTASTLKFPKTTTWNETTQIWYMALQWYSELFFVGEFDIWHCNHYNYIVIRCD